MSTKPLDELRTQGRWTYDAGFLVHTIAPSLSSPFIPMYELRRVVGKEDEAHIADIAILAVAAEALAACDTIAREGGVLQTVGLYDAAWACAGVVTRARLIFEKELSRAQAREGRASGGGTIPRPRKGDR